MKEWLKNGTKRVFNYIIPIIFAGIIWELFRPIFSASTVALGQTGIFFVNLFYAIAALTSFEGFIVKITSCIAGFLLGYVWNKISKSFSIIRTITKGEAPSSPKDIAKLLKKFKIITIILTSLTILTTVIFFIYGLLPLTLKNAFDYKIKILQAVISQEQVNKLNARWCLMRSRQDYLRLMNDIKEYESIHKTELEKLSSGE